MISLIKYDCIFREWIAGIIKSSFTSSKLPSSCMALVKKFMALFNGVLNSCENDSMIYWFK